MLRFFLTNTRLTLIRRVYETKGSGIDHNSIYTTVSVRRADPLTPPFMARFATMDPRKRQPSPK